MAARKPIVAGQFYPGTEKQCRSEIADCITEGPVTGKLPEKIVAGLVPHAGWTFSGDLAGMVFKAIEKANKNVDTFVIFGATHSHFGSEAAVYDKGSWFTPLGEIKIDEELAAAITEKSKGAQANCEVHKYEHSIEVQVPFIQYIFKKAKIVPIMTSPAEYAVKLGIDVAECIKSASDKKIVCIGSTDLTHYGPRYGFNPQGNGEAGIKWAKDVNDRAFIDLAIEMRAERVLNESMQSQSACGPGAAAATIAAAKALGKTKGLLLAHTHSNEVMERKFNQTSKESVGYAAIVY
ncbi:MAG: AmmeMemoRadiSam system protein B [Planctomycetes bacterium]|nr:AmmeMemoRadiSam system protein B [Planctomycetota bacterium]MBU1518361.1 AmmeMemoRadiSam system protein B [Planctomycetota bacterium]MBU2458237.1 AmmeMemoRadiSam system protein B [Planctomycetota bacterium]